MKILVVGGGMGGTILANNLARRLKGEMKSGKVRLEMLSASDKHAYLPGLDARRALPRPGEPPRARHRLLRGSRRGIPARQEPGEDEERAHRGLRPPRDRDG